MLAAGVSLHRVTLPIIICATLMGGLVIIDQEFVIPSLKHKLILKRDELRGATRGDQIYLTPDGSGTTWYARNYSAGGKVIYEPVLPLRDEQGRMIARIAGSEAKPATVGNRKGWLIKDGKLAMLTERDEPRRDMPLVTRIYSGIKPSYLLDLAVRKIQRDEGRTVPVTEIIGIPDIEITDDVYKFVLHAERFTPSGSGGRLDKPIFELSRANGKTLCSFVARFAEWDPGDAPARRGSWKLTDGAIFYPSDMKPQDLVLQQSSKWLSYMSTSDLTSLIRMERVPDRRRAELIKHTRFTAPINNLVMLLLGLPFILSRERNIRASAGMCLLTVMGFFAFVYICQSLDISPLLGAWLPILVFGPVSIFMLDSVKT
jgi:lipopolysaccharide export LptBFGC system permease protein LptF